MPEKPELSIVGGTDVSAQGAVRPGTTSQGYVESAIVGPDGSRFYKTPPPKPPGSADGGGGDMSDWKASVEQRLSELRTDYRNLLIGGIVGGLSLIGAGWWAYTNIVSDIADTNVAITKVSGDLTTLGAKLDGKLNLIIEKVNDHTQTGDRTKKAQTFHQ